MLTTLSNLSTIMPKVHDKECHHSKEKHAGNFCLNGYCPCTCSRQVGQEMTPENVLNWLENKNTPPTREKHKCRVFEGSTTEQDHCVECGILLQEKQEGVFYPEQNDCCEKCHDVYFEKTYPAHTPYHACVNQKCVCHQEKQDAELLGAIARGWCSKENEHKEMDADLVTAIAKEVAPLIASAKEEGRREERHKIYGDIDPLESRKIENQIVIEQARLEVIAQVEEWWSNYKYKDEGGDYIWDDLLRFMRFLKTNSK